MISKTTVFVLFALIAMSSRAESQSEKLPVGGALTNLFEFFTGRWGYFNLIQTQAIQCFNDTTAGIYLDFVITIWNLTGAISAGDRAATTYYGAQVHSLNQTLLTNLNCLTSTQDYINLINAAGGNFTNPEFQFLENIYFQAYTPEWYVAMSQSVNELYLGKYLISGYHNSKVVKEQIANSTEDTLYFQAFKAFQNGIWFSLNLTAPYELSNCYNNTLAQSAVEFYYYWSQTVYNSTLSNAANNSEYYLNVTGAPFLQVVGYINQCLEQTSDQERLTQALGWDVHSPEYDAYISKYFYAMTSVYIATLDGMYQAFEQDNAFLAGNFMGAFYYDVAVFANFTSTIVA